MALRKLARDGGNPVAERRRARVAIPTFADAAQAVHAEHSKAWKAGKHADQWINTLRDYAFPVFGSKRVNLIDTPDLLRGLSPIWLTKPETARRVRQRIGAVLDWAKAAGHRTGDNPIDTVTSGLPKQPRNGGHFEALPYTKISTFIEKLHATDCAESVKLAFEYLILTATRTSEVLSATWAEIDGTTWTIPANRTKSGRAHRIPLSSRCIEILNEARELHGDPFIFPGRTHSRPLSNMVFLMALRRLKMHVTAHGFRSSFRDWSSEKTNFPRDVCEAALAHVIRDKTEAAYRRGDLFERRRELMEFWAQYATATKAEVVALSGKRMT